MLTEGKKRSFLGKLSRKIGDALMGRAAVDEEFLEELEEILITSDVGMDTTMKIVEMLRDEIRSSNLSAPEDIKKCLSGIIERLIDKGAAHTLCQETPLVILMIGINGGGKTTTIGKLAHRLRNRGKTVMLAAADTFRAAAAEQLSIWGERAGINVIRHGEGADPSAVIYDAIQSAKAKGIDVLICDTAGRLQNKKNLMDELEKMNRVIGVSGGGQRESAGAGRHYREKCCFAGEGVWRGGRYNGNRIDQDGWDSKRRHRHNHSG